MGHRREGHHKKKGKNHLTDRTGKPSPVQRKRSKDRLEIVLKSDTAGTLEAVGSAIRATAMPIAVDIIHAGVGPINKSDIMTAETGSRLVVGFNVDAAPKIDHLYREHEVEIRLYDVIYKLVDDIKTIAASLVEHEETEEIIGSAKVIALFKSSRKGIIIGCEVQEGRLALGDSFRLISVMGTVYSGKIESLHIEKNAVNKATTGQQAGIKIANFNAVKTGDLVESFRPLHQRRQPPWQPKGTVLRL